MKNCPKQAHVLNNKRNSLSRSEEAEFKILAFLIIEQSGRRRWGEREREREREREKRKLALYPRSMTLSKSLNPPECQFLNL